MLSGRILTHLCAPHLHDTFTIGYMHRGTAIAKVRGVSHVWCRGEVFLGNPYEVHAGGSHDSTIEYDVYYPSVELIAEAVGCSADSDRQPHLACPILRDPVLIGELLEVLADPMRPDKAQDRYARTRSATTEEGLRRFFRRHTHLFETVSAQELQPIRQACRILRESVDSPVSWPDLPDQVGCSRWHFVRLFHRATGLAPNAYFRQLRLAKALRLICSGLPLADAASATGFADQAHFTREFKRALGRTPGKIARDILGSPTADS